MKIDDYTVQIKVERPEPLWETLVSLQQVMITRRSATLRNSRTLPGQS